MAGADSLAVATGLRGFQSLTVDGWLLFLTRSIRLFAYGSTGVVLALYLNKLGLSDVSIGALLTLTLVGDALISLFVTVHADGWGRRKMLLAGCTLMCLSSVIFALTSGPATTTAFWLLIFAATIGVISPSGNEVGPFMALEQSVLSEILVPQDRTIIFAWCEGGPPTPSGSVFCGAMYY